MGKVIAFAGKGGSGKTTIASLLIRALKACSSGSILAIDADPNSNLAESLGVNSVKSIAQILDTLAADMSVIPQGMTKERFIEYQIQTYAVHEASGVDVLSMGMPEGPGCYCYVNNIVRCVMGKLINEYDYIIVDNEAGLEHLSRKTTRKADLMIIVSAPTKIGLLSAQRIVTLTKELKIAIGSYALVLNQCPNAKEIELPASLRQINLLGQIMMDKEIESMSLSGKSIFDLSDENNSLSIVKNFLTRIIDDKGVGDV